MEQAIHLIFLLCGIVAVGFVLCISVYLVISGLPAIREIGLTKFLFGKVWAPTNATTGPQFGILPFLLTSVYGTAGALLLGVPVGLMTAIFLAKAAPPRLAAVIRTAVQLLAGIPSVVYGLVGMIVLVPAIRRAFGLGSGACLLAAILVLTVMVLPSIINVAETALQAVPREYEEASLALGATETETYFRVSLPAARSGVAAAVIDQNRVHLIDDRVIQITQNHLFLINSHVITQIIEAQLVVRHISDIAGIRFLSFFRSHGV